MENIQLTIAKQSKIYPISICKENVITDDKNGDS